MENARWGITSTMNQFWTPIGKPRALFFYRDQNPMGRKEDLSWMSLRGVSCCTMSLLTFTRILSFAGLFQFSNWGKTVAWGWWWNGRMHQQDQITNQVPPRSQLFFKTKMPRWVQYISIVTNNTMRSCTTTRASLPRNTKMKEPAWSGAPGFWKKYGANMSMMRWHAGCHCEQRTNYYPCTIGLASLNAQEAFRAFIWIQVKPD